MEVLRLKRVEVTDARGAEFIAAKWNQGGSLRLFLLLAVHFLRDGKSSLREPSLHFLSWKWFLADPDRKLWVIIHFENHSSLGPPPSLSSVQGDHQQTKAPLPVHGALLSTPRALPSRECAPLSKSLASPLALPGWLRGRAGRCARSRTMS